jgi:hypothetical protein
MNINENNAEQKHTIITVTDEMGYSWKECKECLDFICSYCGKHCTSIGHTSKVTVECPECEDKRIARR